MPSKKTRMDAGKRDRLVTIQYRGTTDTPDSSSGVPEDTWTTLVADMPAAKTDVSGWKRYINEEPSARFDVIYEMNYRVDIDPDLVDVPKTRRLVVGARTLDVVYAAEIGRRQGVAMFCVASPRVN